MCFSTPVLKRLWAILRNGMTILLFHILKRTYFTFSTYKGWFATVYIFYPQLPCQHILKVKLNLN